MSGLVLDDLTIRAMALVSVVLVSYIANAALTGWLAGRKGRDGGLWAVCALLSGPIALVAIVLAARKVPPTDSERALAAILPTDVRLISDAQLEVAIMGRLARLPGELGPRVEGRPSFRLAGSAAWLWSDGHPMTDEDQARLRRDLVGIGRREGWILTLPGEATPKG